ncbi:MAG: hypothetical protein KIS79_08820, partial [Burkholderiales bacterium]|nr:hypothetical protein [Burkholderiales bacterium]
MIWIDSPPGSGKTSLVASYLEARSIPAVWCTIDSGDDDPASVFHYLALAVRHLARGGSEALPRFAPEHQSAVADFARLFFRALYAALPDGAVIVIDNYQELSPACSTHEALLTAVSQVPPGGSIFCISRTPPPPRYAPLRGAGFMCGLDWDSLRFTLDETRELMASRGLTDDRQLRRLHDQADGWAAGITLMIERLGHVELHSGLVPGDAREVTFDYFASLVFDRVPPEYAHVLFHVAFLPYVNAEMASALSGSERAGEVLMDLHRARLFVDKRSGTTAVYVFHALFRDFLQSRAWTRLGTQSTRDLMVRCADVLEASQDPEAAVPLRIATQDWERLSGTLLRLAEEMLVTGRHETLEQWIAALPESERHRQPMLIYWQGVGRAQSALPSGIVLLECALERFDELGDRESQFLCLTALLKFGYAVAYVGLESMDRWTGALLDRLPDENLLDVSPRLELRIWSALCSALMLIRPWHPWVEIAARRVLALLEQGVERAEVVAAATAAFDLAVIRGEINVCERLVVQLKPLLCAPSIPASEVCWAWY